MTASIVASAIFDHLCDRRQELLAIVGSAMSQEWVRSALGRERVRDPLAGKHKSSLLAYLGALAEQLARTWRELPGGVAGAPGRAEAALARSLEAAYLAQRASAGRLFRNVEIVWGAPFVVALHLVAATPDARPEIDLRGYVRESKRIGQLLSLVDDVVDLEDDVREGSANQYLARLGVMADTRPSGVPWEGLLAPRVIQQYVADIVTLLRTFPEDEEREALVAWLYHWLAS
jgi:hypothetical protein